MAAPARFVEQPLRAVERDLARRAHARHPARGVRVRQLGHLEGVLACAASRSNSIPRPGPVGGSR